MPTGRERPMTKRFLNFLLKGETLLGFQAKSTYHAEEATSDSSSFPAVMNI
jgi:hypothetical protein